MQESQDGSTSSPAMLSGEPLELYRPALADGDIEELFRKPHLSEREILDFINIRSTTDTSPARGDVQIDRNIIAKQKFYERRKEIRDLAEQLKSGMARIDEDGRLVSAARPARTTRTNLPAQAPDAFLDGNNLLNPPNPPPLPPPAENHNPEQDIEHLLEMERREAAEAIARAVQRHRDQGVPEDELQLILVEPREGTPTSLTFRRICFAVLAVVTAFVCVILQTLPLLSASEFFDPNYDQLMGDLLHIRSLVTHTKHCPGLHRDGKGKWQDRWLQALGFYSNSDCDEGVLQIPTMHVLLSDYLHSSKEEARLLQPYVAGFNVKWAIQCQGMLNDRLSGCMAKSEAQGSLECHAQSRPQPHCFRGVHDHVIDDAGIDAAMRLGNHHIQQGGDHFDVHYDVAFMENEIPSVLNRLRGLLRDQYGISHANPVAYRINTVGPMDGHEVNLYRPPASTLNQSKYLLWIEKSKRQNERAAFSLPWPFRIPPIRDQCNLIADMEADPRFAIQTTVFLVDGAGSGYRGGITLYMDSHDHYARGVNANPKRRVRRGLTVDGSRGRVIVSTGGLENRHCRLPTRAGLRTVLQIWWDC